MEEYLKSRMGMESEGIKNSDFRLHWSSMGLNYGFAIPWGCHLMSLNCSFLIFKIIFLKNKEQKK